MLATVAMLIWLKKVSIAIAIPAALGFFALWWLLHLKSRVLRPLRRFREANQRVSEFRTAVNAAQTVRVRCVESNAVVEVTGDEVNVCLFDVGENQTYWIDPYWMIPGRPPPDWPNRKFEVFQVPGWKDEIGPFSLGKKLLPRETFEFRDLFEYYIYEPPADGLIDQSLDDFLQSAQARNRSGRETSAT